MTLRSIAVVGAGIAGLACANRLTKAHVGIRVFDKGRSPGGRLATRRVETPVGPVQFDHGAQYFSTRDAKFEAVVQDMVTARAVCAWSLDDERFRSAKPERRWIGTPSMSAFARRMAAGLHVTTSARLVGATKESAGWSLEFEMTGSGEHVREGPFDAVVFALPAEQAGQLLASIAPAFSREALAVQTAPCWAGLMAFDRPLETPFNASRTQGPLSWVARENSKPGRSGPEAWIVHASPSWSRTMLECPSEEAVVLLWQAFRDLVPAAPAPVWRQAHRWRYAMVETPAQSPFSWDPERALGVCGDWRIGPRVEAAWLSGDSLGAAISA